MTPQAKKLFKTRLRHAKFISTLIIWQPFVRAVILNGSLTSQKVGPSSDIDLLIIAKSGRIFTARFFCLLAVWLTGLKRSSDEQRSHRGRVCLNYFLTDGFLIIPHHRSAEMNRYCAENYSSSILLSGDEAIFDKFLSMNEQWMNTYLADKIGKRARDKEGHRLKPRAIEKYLSGQFGQKLENYLKKIQYSRIERDPRTKRYPDLIYVDDREMRFHPPKENRPKI